MIKFVIRFIILSILVTAFITGMGGISSSAHASSLAQPGVSRYQQPGTCGVYTLHRSTNAQTNEVGYGLILRLYMDTCGHIYVNAEGFVPEGEPGGGYLCSGGNCLNTGYGALHGSYYTVSSPTFLGSCPNLGGDSVIGSFTQLNGSSNFTNNIYCV